ncbi:MAG: hypothetical protein IT302_00335 [Dehalococcoidia bacterium]|nr:hypothetical protein [Dehalococcoidia bacterium]
MTDRQTLHRLKFWGGWVAAAIVAAWLLNLVWWGLLSPAARAPSLQVLEIPAGTGAALEKGATFSFADNSLVLAPGATVRVVNKDSQQHSIGSFNVPAGETLDITLPRTGNGTELSCSIHPSGYLDLGIEKRPPLLSTIIPAILLGAPFGLLTAVAVFLTGKIDSDPKQHATA